MPNGKPFCTFRSGALLAAAGTKTSVLLCLKGYAAWNLALAHFIFACFRVNVLAPRRARSVCIERRTWLYN